MNLSNEHSPDLAEFPDNRVPPGNCYVYVFYKLGIDDPGLMRTGTLPPIEEVETKLFQVVYSLQDADAVGVTDKFGTYKHMAYINKNRGNQLFHRLNVGRPIETTSLDELRKTYPESGYKFVYLKKKEQQNIATARQKHG